MNAVEDHLAALGISLPQPVAPIANYVPAVRSGDLLYVSGQVSIDETGGIKGTVGVDVDLEKAQAAARLCGINLIAQMSAALGGDLTRVRRVVKLSGFVQAGPDFIDIPKVINGCSDLMVVAFGEAGRHARSAPGQCPSPLNVPIIVDAIVAASD